MLFTVINCNLLELFCNSALIPKPKCQLRLLLSKTLYRFSDYIYDLFVVYQSVLVTLRSIYVASYQVIYLGIKKLISVLDTVKLDSFV